jgi:hypothetical protein
MAGDVWDYVYPLQAFFDHGTPDIRNEDIAALDPILKANGMGHLGPYTVDNLPPFTGIMQSPQGSYFANHFWFYSLLVLPAKFLLWLFGGNQLCAFQLTNLALYVCTLYVVLFHCRATRLQRLILAGFAGVSPVFWYLPWPSPESTTWAFALLGLVSLVNKRYPVAAGFTSLGAMQNPPLLFVAGLIFLLSLRERRWLVSCLTGAAAALSLTPSIFYYCVFGVANPIVASGGTDRSLISWTRTWSFLTDLNQGMLPYVPVLLILSVIALLWILRKRSLPGLCAVAMLGLMIAAAQTTTNWNSGAAGMMRYATWMLPLFAWLVAEYVPATKRLVWVTCLGIALQAFILARPADCHNYLAQTSVARLVLSKTPILYDPVPEIFIERQLHSEVAYRKELLPIPFVSKDWRVTKVLADRDSLKRLPDKFDVNPDYLARVNQEHQSEPGLFYLTPPKGAINLKPVPTEEQFNAAIHVTVAEMAHTVRSSPVTVRLHVANTGTRYSFLPQASGSFSPVRLVYRILNRAEQFLAGGFWELTDPIGPGETQTLSVTLPLPLRKGQYFFEVKPFMENVAWAERAFQMRITITDEPAFSAEITP